MASVQELVSEITALKNTSEELSNMLSYAGTGLQDNISAIVSVVMGSRSGQEAVMSLSVASKSVLDSAASIRTLGRSCDECIAELSK